MTVLPEDPIAGIGDILDFEPSVARQLVASGRHTTRSAEWFQRHGRTAVFTGRMVPGVRSMISIPAGVLLGQQWQTVEQYTMWLDLAMVAVVVYVLARLLWRRWREDDTASTQERTADRTEGART